MSNWQNYCLDDLAYYFNGKAFKPNDWKSDGVKIIRIEQINNPNGDYDYYQGIFPANNSIDNDDLIFSWSATLKVVIWKNGKGVLNQHLFKVIPKNFINKHYLYFLLDYNMLKLADTSHGSTMKHIKRGELKKYHVQVPEYTVQQKIAKILSVINGQIEKTEAIIAKYQAIKQGMLHDLFTRGIDVATGKLRPKYEHAPHLYENSPLGMIPREWKVDRVADLIQKKIIDDIQDGNHGELHPKSSDFVSRGIPFVMASNISNDEIDLENCNRIPIDLYSKLRIGFSKAGDILLSHKASIGFVAVVPMGINNIMLTPQVTYYRVLDKKALSPEYLMQFLRSNLFQIPLHNLAKQSTRDYIGITMQKMLRIAYPINVTEQYLIGHKLTSICRNEKIEKKYLQKLQNVKRGVMSDLLSGKVEVIDETLIAEI